MSIPCRQVVHQPPQRISRERRKRQRSPFLGLLSLCSPLNINLLRTRCCSSSCHDTDKQEPQSIKTQVGTRNLQGHLDIFCLREKKTGRRGLSMQQDLCLSPLGGCLSPVTPPTPHPAFLLLHHYQHHHHPPGNSVVTTGTKPWSLALIFERSFRLLQVMNILAWLLGQSPGSAVQAPLGLSRLCSWEQVLICNSSSTPDASKYVPSLFSSAL